LQVADFLYVIFEKLNLADIVGKVLANGADNPDQTKIATAIAANLSLPERLTTEVVAPSLEHPSPNVRSKGAELLLLLTEGLKKTTDMMKADLKAEVFRRCYDRAPNAVRLVKGWRAALADTHGLAHLSQALPFLLSAFPTRYAAHIDVSSLMNEAEAANAHADVKLHLARCLALTDEGHSTSCLSAANMALLLSTSASSESSAAAALATVLRRRHWLPNKGESTDDWELRVWMEKLKAVEPTRRLKVAQVWAEKVKEGLDTSSTSKETEDAETFEGARRQFKVQLSPLSLALFSSKDLWKEKEYTVAVFEDLLALQERPEPLARLVLDKAEQCKGAIALANKVLKGKQPFKVREVQADGGSHVAVVMKVMKLLCNFKVTGSGLDHVCEALRSIEDQKERGDIAELLARSEWLKASFAPFGAQEGDVSDLVCCLVDAVGKDSQAVGHLRSLYVGDLIQTLSNVSPTTRLDVELFKGMKLSAAEVEEIVLALIQTLPGSDHSSLDESIWKLLAAVLTECVNLGVLFVDKETIMSQGLSVAAKVSCFLEDNGLLRSIMAILRRHSKRIALEGDKDLMKAILSCDHHDAFVMMEHLVRQRKGAAETLIATVSKKGECSEEVIPAMAAAMGHPIKETSVRKAMKWLAPYVGRFLRGEYIKVQGEDIKAVSSAMVSIIKEAEAKGVLERHSYLDVRLEDRPKDSFHAEAWLYVLQDNPEGLTAMVLKPCFELISSSWKNIRSEADAKGLLDGACRVLGVASARLDGQVIRHLLESEDGQSVWSKCVRNVLKHALKANNAADFAECCAKSLDVVGSYSRIFYRSENAGDMVQAGQVLSLTCDHSGFLPMLLHPTHKHSPAKASLAILVGNLLEVDASLCNENRVPAFLGAYNATLSSADRAILRVLAIHERAGCGCSMLQPALWGHAAISRYSVVGGGSAGKGGNNIGSSLWKMPKVSEVTSHGQPIRALPLNYTASYCLISTDPICGGC
jgi:hypothetical protein